jgi:hypothetical protein
VAGANGRRGVAWSEQRCCVQATRPHRAPAASRRVRENGRGLSVRERVIGVASRAADGTRIVRWNAAVTVGPVSYSLWLSAGPACPPRPACAVAACEPADTSNPDYLPRRPYWQHLQIENVRRVAVLAAEGEVGRRLDVMA